MKYCNTAPSVFEDLLAKTIGKLVKHWEVRTSPDGTVFVGFANSQNDGIGVEIRSAKSFTVCIVPAEGGKIERDFESVGSVMIFLREWT